jgi:peptide/nickel transport system substrate-binding protein
MPLDGPEKSVGRPGGELRTLIGGSKDTRLMVVYGYARLVGFNTKSEIEPDILERFESQDDKVFTLHLRPGHRWSDGHPFTAEDFRYYWEDCANNAQLSPIGPPAILLWTARSRASR